MRNVVKHETQSITTSAKQTLYIDGDDAEFMKGKRVLIVDDVISTGGSLSSLESLVESVGGEIVGRMAILAEGDAQTRDDIIYLEKLPLFDKNGNII
jgi:adenine phosphoribosyltransferase